MMLFGYVVLVALTVPFVGFDAPEQRTGSHVGAVPANVPSAWQIRMAEPFSE